MLNYKHAKTVHLRLGRRGEKLAYKYLCSENIDVLFRNYRNRKGEIDIIARDGGIICFVEVKTRRHTTRSRPAEGLGSNQKLRISQAAEAYLHSLNDPDVIYRFDLIEIVIGRWDICELRYWRSHFQSKKI